MLKEKRFDFILKQLEQAEMLTYERLAADLQVSADTVRRDIDYLHNNGLLSKVRGGAMQRAKNPLTFQDRSNYLKQEKEIIALKAQQFLVDGMTVFMDGGTTICALISQLAADSKLRIVTTNMQAIPILSTFKNIELIVLGGRYNLETATTLGTETCLEISKYIADVYFMGTCGVHNQLGITAAVQEDAEVKRAMLQNSKQVIALANHDYLGIAKPFKVCQTDRLAALITNLASDDSALNDFRNLNLKIV